MIANGKQEIHAVRRRRIPGWRTLVLACATLVACGSVPPAPVVGSGSRMPAAAGGAVLPGSSIDTAGLPDPGGPIRLSVASVWLPGSSGFGEVAASQKRNGRLVFTDNSVLWQYRTPAGIYRTAHRVAFADIRSVALAESGVDRLIVLQGQDYRYDAFGVMRPDEKAVDALATVQAYRTILELLHLPAPVASGHNAF